MARISTIIRGSATITSGTIADTETIEVAGKTYTFQTVLTDVDGNVLIGADDDASLDNLARAINLGAGAGVDYAAATVLNADAGAISNGSGATVTVEAKLTGTDGNALTLSEATTGATVSGATFAGGVGRIFTAVNEMLATMQLNSEVIGALAQLDESSSRGV